VLPKPCVLNVACSTLNVACSTLYEWVKDHPEFSDMLEDLQAKQERELIVNGLHYTKLNTLATRNGLNKKASAA
jgi:hypothetical protein